MANEIKLTLNLKLENGDLKYKFNPGQIQIDQATKRLYHAVLDIGTTEENVTFTDITTEGVCVLFNHDASNFVQWGADATGMKTIGRLRPSSIPAMFGFEPGATLRMKADTGTCKVEVLVFEL